MVTKNYADIVNLTSRRVTIPDYVENKTVTIKYLAELCSKDFLKARINDKLTVEESMNTTMKNMLKGLKFAHPKTSCALDQHCNDWYANEVPAFMKLKIHKTVPRCVEESREFYRSCELRATEGQYCPIFDKNGKRLSDLGSLEHPCDKGLTCVQVEAGGWLQNWEIYKAPVGRCLKTK